MRVIGTLRRRLRILRLPSHSRCLQGLQLDLLLLEHAGSLQLLLRPGGHRGPLQQQPMLGTLEHLAKLGTTTRP